MNKMIFWRSNCITVSSGHGLAHCLKACFPYRSKPFKTLNPTFRAGVFLGLLLAIAFPALVFAEDSTNWPEAVYFPQRSEQAKQASQSPVQSKNSAKPHRLSRLWPHRTKKAKDEAEKPPYSAVPPKPSAEMADPPPSPYPLLRLPVPIITQQGVVPAGIYLVKTELSDPMIGSATAVQKKPKAVLTGETRILLTRQNVAIASIPIHAAGAPKDDGEGGGSTSPIKAVDAKIPPIVKIRAELSADQKTLRLFILEGNHYFKSDSYSIEIDARRKLNF
jgi:hypothetical protein